MNALLTVLKKELTDAFRDRRMVMVAFVVMPLVFPLIFAGLGTLGAKKQTEKLENALELPVIGADNAPNLVALTHYFLPDLTYDSTEGSATFITSGVGTGQEVGVGAHRRSGGRHCQQVGHSLGNGHRGAQRHLVLVGSVYDCLERFNHDAFEAVVDFRFSPEET